MLLKLARPGALAGQVIRHSTQVLENMLETHGPMVYKIGFSYDPHNRFFNKSFGYIHERQQWERMVIVYVSDETLGPAFLEAALIQRFKGPLIEWFVYRSSMLLYVLAAGNDVEPAIHCTQGKQGCRNERDGGDTVCAHLDGPFFTYFVYQSFKREPFRAQLSDLD